MVNETAGQSDAGIHPSELDEWCESLDDVLHRCGPDQLRELLVTLQERAYLRGVSMPFTANTPYVNTIPLAAQARYPGNLEIERRIKSIIRWNAMAMVVRANRESDGIGGHISTFASCATLYEVGFNHFFHARTDDHTGDLVYFQGHGVHTDRQLSRSRNSRDVTQPSTTAIGRWSTCRTVDAAVVAVVRSPCRQRSRRRAIRRSAGAIFPEYF